MNKFMTDFEYAKASKQAAKVHALDPTQTRKIKKETKQKTNPSEVPVAKPPKKLKTGVSVLIHYCPCCGAIDQKSHTHYTDRCMACGKRFSSYSSLKSRGIETAKQIDAFDEICRAYRRYAAQGYKVPKEFMK